MTIGMDASTEIHGLEAPLLSDAPDLSIRCEKFVSFQLGDNIYAVHAPAVAEVMHPSPVTLLPNAPASLLGIAPLRGEIIAVVDLRGLVGEFSSLTPGPKAKQLVLKKAGDDAVSIAFVVDRLGEIVTLPTGVIRRTDDTPQTVAGECSLNDRHYRIIDHLKVLSA